MLLLRRGCQGFYLLQKFKSAILSGPGMQEDLLEAWTTYCDVKLSVRALQAKDGSSH